MPHNRQWPAVGAGRPAEQYSARRRPDTRNVSAARAGAMAATAAGPIRHGSGVDARNPRGGRHGIAMGECIDVVPGDHRGHETIRTV